MIAACYRLLPNIRKSTDLNAPEGKLILIVDDDEAIRDLLELLVRKEGFAIQMAADGKEALKKAKAVHPDLILLDLMLPKLNGFELLRELQEDDTSDIPIVIITGRNTNPSTRGMMKREPNVKGFMEKPVKQHVLAALMYTLLKTQKQ